MNFQWSAITKFASMGGAVMGLSIGLLLPTSAIGNGLGENAPYRFEGRDRLRALEMQLLKESGFYDSQSGVGGGSGGGGGDTIIHGDQINCIIQSSTLANSNASGLEATTGSLTGVADGNMGASNNANEADAYERGEGQLSLGQENTGNQSANINDSNMNSEVGEFNGGGSSAQTVSTTQDVDDSTLSASISNARVCDSVTTN